MYEKEKWELYPNDENAYNDEQLSIVSEEWLLPAEELTEEQIDEMIKQLDKEKK